VSRIRLAGATRAAIVIGALALFPFLVGQQWVQIGVLTLMYAGLATAWNLVGGYAGYVSLGHVAFFGVGAYAVAVAFTRWFSIGGGYRPFYVLPLIGIGVALVSVPIGWIAFRTRAATFAIVTLTLLFVVQQLAFNLHSLTQGSLGILLPQPSFPNSEYEQPFYYAMLGLLVLGLLVSRWVATSKLGLTLFAIGMVLMVYLGGKGSLWGPVLGALILVPAQQELAYDYGSSELYLIAYAGVFLAVMLVMPRGILPSLTEQWRRRSARSRPTRPSQRAEEPATS